MSHERLRPTTTSTPSWSRKHSPSTRPAVPISTGTSSAISVLPRVHAAQGVGGGGTLLYCWWLANRIGMIPPRGRIMLDLVALILQNGGFILWPIAATSIAALTVAIERLWRLLPLRARFAAVKARFN